MRMQGIRAPGRIQGCKAPLSRPSPPAVISVFTLRAFGAFGKDRVLIELVFLDVFFIVFFFVLLLVDVYRLTNSDAGYYNANARDKQARTDARLYGTSVTTFAARGDIGLHLKSFGCFWKREFADRGLLFHHVSCCLVDSL
jgi:hypothetical protein